MSISSDSHSNRSYCEALPFLIQSGSQILFRISHKDISEFNSKITGLNVIQENSKLKEGDWMKT